MVPLGGLVISDVACRRAGPLSKSVAFLWRRGVGELPPPEGLPPLSRSFARKWLKWAGVSFEVMQTFPSLCSGVQFWCELHLGKTTCAP